MKASHDRHLRVIGAIDDDILLRTDTRRADFLAERRRRRVRRYRTSIGAAAGVLAASILLIVLLPLFAGSVPVYRGMSVSGVPTVAAYREGGEQLFTRTQAAEVRFGDGDNGNHNGQGNGNHGGQENGNHGGQGNGGGQSDSDLSPIGSTYYATPGEDVLIYIHIDNPKNYEILSFTLNGVKYSSYMFEPGSTMQTLILKVNVGEQEGFREFTIDAIKYIDGEAIKDVRMRGERTVRVGVAAEGNNLGTGIHLSAASYRALAFEVEICDVLGILTDGSVPVAAKLYRGDTPVEAQSLTLTDGVATVAFTELAPGAAYRLDVTATYDKDDGEGTVEHVLKSVTYETTHPFTLKHTVSVGPKYYLTNGWLMEEEIHYPNWEPSAPVLCAKLLCDDESFTVVSVMQTKDGVTRTVTDLSAIPVGRGESTVSVTYTYGDEEYTSVLPLSDVLSTEELRQLYYVIKPYQQNQHDGVDIGCFESYTLVGNWEEAKAALGSVWDEETLAQYPFFNTTLERTEVYVPVYALASGYVMPSDLYLVDTPDPDITDLLGATCLGGVPSVARPDLDIQNGVYVEAGTFLGVIIFDTDSSSSNGCHAGQPSMHVGCARVVGVSGQSVDPTPFIPNLHRLNSGTVTKEPTCTTAGERVYTCTTGGCGALYTEILPALGHKTEDTWQTDGVSHYHVCTRTGCGEHLDTAPCTFTLRPLDSEQHAVCCTVCGGVKAGTQGEHTFAGGETVVKEPTCTAVGELLRECTTCDHSVTLEIPMLAHAYGEEHPTAISDTHHAVLCTVCGTEKPDSRAACAFGEAIITPPSEVDCTPGKSTRTCAACGNTVEQVTEPSTAAEHQLANAVYDKGAKTVTWTCAVCDVTYTVGGVTAANTFGAEDPVGPTNHTPGTDMNWYMCVETEGGDSYLSVTAAQPDTSGTWFYTGPLNQVNAPSFYVSFDIRLLGGASLSMSMKSTEGAWLGGGDFVLPQILGDGSVKGGTASIDGDGYGTAPYLAPAGTVGDTTFTNVTLRYDAEAGHMTVWINGTQVLSQAVDSFKDVRIAMIRLTVSPPSGMTAGSGMHLDNVIVAYGTDAAVKINSTPLSE